MAASRGLESQAPPARAIADPEIAEDANGTPSTSLDPTCNGYAVYSSEAAEKATCVCSRRGFAASALRFHLYTISHLIFFSFLGTLARLGLQALTSYPGAPVTFPVLWANVAGSLVMGFLTKDAKLFRAESASPTCPEHPRHLDSEAARKAAAAAKKTIPLYIGLSTGFCGSCTSFSSFMRDVFLAVSNDLPLDSVGRNGGDSFMAALAVVVTTVGLSLCALVFGAHLALATERFLPTLPYTVSCKVMDPVITVLAWGCWLGAVFLSIWPPEDSWRGQAVFALVFAPLGCLARFYVSLYLNKLIPSFPVGTFAVNMFGTAILGMAWDLQHIPMGGIAGCQVLQGIEDGFCGCLTTVSTWVNELSTLKKGHAYKYGIASTLAGFSILLVIMGSVRWTHGFSELLCTH